MISVITVVYNDVNGIRDTILSVVNQRLAKWEYVVVDGGSTDGTLDIVRTYESEIDCIISEEDEGLYDAMNKALNHCNGDYVIFLNSSDVFYNDVVLYDAEKYISSHPDAICYYGKTIWSNGKMQFPFIIPIILRMPNHQSMFISLCWHLSNNYDLDYKIAADLSIKMAIFKQNGYKKMNKLISISKNDGISQHSNNYDAVFREMVTISRTYYGSMSIIFIIFEKIVRWIKSSNIQRLF